MARTFLTDVAIRKLKPPTQGQVTYWDRTPGLVGFGVRVSEGGRKSFVFMRGSERRRYTIGTYPDWSLADARTEAKRLSAELTLSMRAQSTISFEEAVRRFVGTHCKDLRTGDEYERLLRKHFVPTLKHRPLDRITTNEITHILDGMDATPVLANNAFARVRTLFRWARRRRYIVHSPCEGLQLPSRLASRDRVLSDTELPAVYKAATDYPFGTIVRLLMLTGQRRSEIGGLRWEYIDGERRTITLPASVTKNKREHTFPYGRTCAELLSNVPRLGDGYLFPARGSEGRPYSGWSAGKTALDEACPIKPWILHDLRRTVATNLAALGTPPHVTERLLNHVSGTVSGVAAIYNRYVYMDEMRTAIDQWERKLAILLAK